MLLRTLIKGMISLLPFCAFISNNAQAHSPDTLAVRRIMELVPTLREHYADSSFVLIEKGLLLAKAADDKKGITDLLIWRGAYYWGKNNYVAAIDDYNEAMLLSRKWKQPRGVHRAFINLGQTYSKLGDYPRAIEYFLNGIAFGDSIHADNSSAYNSLAVAYRKNQNFDQAIKAMKESIRLIKPSDRASGLVGGIYVNMGNIFLNTGELTKALDYQLKALHIFDSLHQNRGIVICYNNISEVLLAQGKFTEAEAWSQKSLALSRSEGLTSHEASALEGLAHIETARGHNVKAIFYLKQAIQLEEVNHHKTELIRLYGAISNCYELTGRSDLALQYLKKNIVTKDSVFNQETANKIANQRISFEINKREIDSLVFQQERKIALLNRNILIGLVTALAIIMLILSYYQYLRIKKNRLLLKQMEEIHLTKRQLLERDLENQKLKQEELQREIERKSKELTTHALNLIQKNEVLEEIKMGLVDLNGEMKVEMKKDIQKLVSSINLSHHQDKEWLSFKAHFDKIHTGFFENLQREYPDLSGNDLKICALVKLNLGSKETASILGISAESVKTARYRLRKKLQLTPSQNLATFLFIFE